MQQRLRAARRLALASQFQATAVSPAASPGSHPLPPLPPLLPPQFKVKMVTSDDDMTTDIVVEGDQEEITRMSKVRSKCVLHVIRK